MENRYAMSHNVQWLDIENGFLLNNNSAESRNNYSPKRMYEVVVESLALDTMNVSELLLGIFGYLDKNATDGSHSAAIIQSYEVLGQKYLISDLLRRLDFLKLR
jgi:hypothetical protein